MPRRRFLGALTAAGCGWAMVGRSGVSKQEESAKLGLDKLLQSIQAKHEVPALAAAYIQGDDVITLDAVGKRIRGKPHCVEVDDRFHLGSCTKAMTATLVGVLVEEGVITWEITIAEALPQLVEKIRPEFHDVTLVDLLAHRGGVPGEASPRRYQALESQYRRLSGPLHAQRVEMARRALSDPPSSEPGTQHSYSNLGYIVAGAMLEEITGKLWEELMEARLFEPLGMTTAGFGAPGSLDGIDQPRGHTRFGCMPVAPGPEADNAPVLGPAGTVHSSMRDWAKFVSLHVRGAQGVSGLLLRPTTMEVIQQDRADQGYGLGWAIVERDWAKSEALTHAGSNTLWYAVAWIAPNRDVAFLAAANWGSDKAFRAIDAAVAGMIERYLE